MKLEPGNKRRYLSVFIPPFILLLIDLILAGIAYCRMDVNVYTYALSEISIDWRLFENYEKIELEPDWYLQYVPMRSIFYTQNKLEIANTRCIRNMSFDFYPSLLGTWDDRGGDFSYCLIFGFKKDHTCRILTGEDDP